MELNKLVGAHWHRLWGHSLPVGIFALRGRLCLEGLSQGLVWPQDLEEAALSEPAFQPDTVPSHPGQPSSSLGPRGVLLRKEGRAAWPGPSPACIRSHTIV